MRVSNKFIFTGIAVILIFVAVYQWLKSSTPIEIEKENFEQITVQGRYYEGDWKSVEIQTLFKSADSISKTCNGISSAIYYNDPYADDGLIKAFVGVMECETEQSYFNEKRELSGGNFLKGKISNDYFQIPQRIYLEMQDHAKEKDIKIGDFSVEQYFSDTLMIVLIPILEK